MRSAIVALAFALVGCASAVDDSDVASVETLVSVFDRMGLGFGRDGNTQGRAVKWAAPIRVRFLGDYDDSDVATVRRAFSTMQRLTGISVEIPSKSGQANFAVHFIEKYKLHEEVLKIVKDPESVFSIPIDGICMAIPNYVRSITSANIFVAGKNDRKLRETCVRHELMHAYGLLGHHQKYRPSILFFRNIDLARLSTNDMILLRTLYDPRIRPGMKRSLALPLSRKIIAELTARLRTEGDPERALALEAQ